MIADIIRTSPYSNNKNIYKNFVKQDISNVSSYKDTFTKPAILMNDEVNVSKNEKKSKNIIYGIILGAGAVGLIAYFLRGKHIRQINTLTNELEQANLKKLATETELANKKQLLKNLEKRLDGILESNPKTNNSYINELTEHYRKLINDTTINYNPLVPIKNGEPFVQKSIYSYIDFRAPNIINNKSFIQECFNTESFISNINNLKTGESFKIPFLQDSSKIKITKASNATIQPENIDQVGKLVNCDKALNAGITANWDNEKIARDLFQNFYDGHGHTLDGVNMVITKTEEGKFKIRIEGKSTYNCEYISGDGLSGKSNNLADAGGFGEGLKMVNVSMLAKKLTNKIRYGSADWIYDITAGSKYMKRQLQKAVTFIDGNFVEFETSNANFLKKIIKATNFFEHSKNPDFKGLQYEDADWGFAFLGKGNNGNLYVTQRFAYESENNWESSLEGLKMFFRKKPDTKFSKGRDRTYISKDDLQEIIQKFVANINKKNALNIILDMQSVWEKENKDSKFAYKILLEELCKKFMMDFNNIDLTKQKFVAVSDYENTATLQRLKEYGYTLCDYFFSYIGMPTSKDVLKMYSTHTPLQPTFQEIQKMKLLGEAVKIVSETDTTGNLIKTTNPGSPVFIFDRKHEKCENTLAEAMINHETKEYLGHWVSRDHLNNASFPELLATWLHEILHQHAGDGESLFGYKLTNLLGNTFKLTNEQRAKLKAIQNAFEEIK